MWEIIKKDDIFSHYHYQKLLEEMTFDGDNEYGFHKFLQKFSILDKIVWNEDLVDLSVKKICDDMKSDEIDYAFLDFSINKYLQMGWTIEEAIEFICDSFDHHSQKRVGLLLSLKYESTLIEKTRYLKLIDNKISDRLVGIDFVGDEVHYNCSGLVRLIEPWLSAGKLVRAHVGEYGDEDNIRSAIVNARVTNIAHGIKIIDPELISIAIDNNISFDLGLTSNYLTGVVVGQHPIVDMMKNGLKLTIGSDDPIVCSTTLSKEYELAIECGLNERDCHKLRSNAVDCMTRFALR